jgi:hypothetical protein
MIDPSAILLKVSVLYADPPKTQAPNECSGRCVFGVVRNSYLIEIELAKCVVQDRAACFCRIALTLEWLPDPVRKFGLVVPQCPMRTHDGN